MGQYSPHRTVWAHVVSLIVVATLVHSAILVGVHVHRHNAGDGHDRGSDRCHICTFALTVFTAAPIIIGVPADPGPTEILASESDSRPTPCAGASVRLRAPPASV